MPNRDKALESARCTEINLKNLANMIPGLSELPMFKIIQLQLKDTIIYLLDGE